MNLTQYCVKFINLVKDPIFNLDSLILLRAYFYAKDLRQLIL